MRIPWCLALALTTVAPALGQQFEHRLQRFPSEAVEGAPLRFSIVYAAPERVKLHAEVKDRSNVVHASQMVEVQGKGVAQFSIPIPPGRFRGQLLVAYWFGDDWREPRIPILHVGPIPVYSAAEGKRLVEMDRQAAGIRRRLGLDARRPAVGVLSGGWAGRSAALANAYVRALASKGLRCVQLGPEEVANRGVLKAGLIRMLVIPEAQTYPGEAIPALLSYLRSGGHLIALGAPAFDRLVRRVSTPTGTAWMDEAQLAEQLRQTPATRSILDMTDIKPSDRKRSANDMKAPCSWDMVSDGPTGRALYHEIGNLTGWETLEAPLTRPGAGGDNLVTFRARGGPTTTMLAVELREKDGSRWIASVPITRTWRRYALPVSAFRLWDPDNRSNRRGADDHLNLSDAAAVAVGLAFTHTTLPGGKHHYWFSDLGTAKGPDVIRFTVPTLDTLSPDYKLYPVRQATSLDGSHGATLITAKTPSLPRDILSAHPRPTGSGFDKARKYRWVPLLQVRGPQGVAGTVATLMIHTRTEFAGGRWASFTAAERQWYARADVQQYVAALAERMLQPAMFVEAGCQFYGVFADDTPLLGARVAAPRADGLTVRLEVREAGNKDPVFSRTLPLKDHPDGATAEVRWTPEPRNASPFRVTATLLQRGKAIDVLSHEVTVRADPAVRKPALEWVTAKDGEFYLGGRIWSPHGVNYMPSSGIAAEDGHYFEQWLSSESYDPLVIDRDLARIKAAGFNMVSVFIYIESTRNRNLVDLLNRCDHYGLRVNLSLRPGTPLDFQWPGIGEIITENRLADDPTVFAYDLAWEPMWGYRDQRRRWDGEWEEWLRQRYGSVEAAERDWGEQVPREGGKVAGPSDADVTASSSIPRVVAAYRRFQDDLLSRKHMEARQKIRSVDTRHLLSFRMTVAGDPTCGPTIMPYDFAGLARSMDFMAPEGYGRIGERDRVRPGWFTAAYSRMMAPGRPVFWTEFGYTLWNQGERPDPTPGLSFADAFDERHYLPATIAFTERFYREFYQMVLDSGSVGTVCWWYAGGFRFGENSDFGIIHPDGTWRGLTHIIKEFAVRFAERSPAPAPDAWITVDRDRHPDGIYGVYSEVKDTFWKLVDEGKFPGLRTDGDNTDSASAPLIAVGNVPCTGHNPPKYLNAEFETVEVLDPDGRWTAVPYEGSRIRPARGDGVRLRVVAGNNGVARWLARDGDGQVRAVVRRVDGAIVATAPIKADVERFGTSEVIEMIIPPVTERMTLEVTMDARGRSLFGERRRLQVEVSGSGAGE